MISMKKYLRTNNKSDYEHNMTNTAGLKKWAYGVN